MLDEYSIEQRATQIFDAGNRCAGTGNIPLSRWAVLAA